MLPFAIKPSKKIVAVGNAEIGQIYLQSINGRKGIERAELDRVDVVQSKVRLTLLQLAMQISQDKEITPDEALNMIFSESDQSQVLIEYQTELDKLQTLQREVDQLKDKAVTIMIRERIAYPVVVSQQSNKESNTLYCYSVPVDLMPDEEIKFPKCTVTVQSKAYEGEDQIQCLELPKTLVEGDLGFLLSEDSKSELIGNQEWELEDTYSLPADLIDAIYEFYLTESSGGVKEEKKGQSKNRSKSLKNSSQDPQSIGENSTGESKDTPASMNNSEEAILETLPIG